MRHSLFLVACVLCAAIACSAAPMTTLRVQVTSQDGKPIDRASVLVKFVKGRSKIKMTKLRTTYETKTNQDGFAKIPPIPQGTIQVQVIAANYQTFGDLFDVDEEQKTLQVKLNPPQAQYSAH